ncbi:response regulator [Aurantiacibacter rhizosphaerae]|uniref:Response regulator n=1 Tax=Aurantiacibacter rhizosphaerae TaxID=2691582 RepID=A0A844XA20_9SPHN|nr:response regulator [Aurantiacibacter rhizosphaerae]MWV27207.1 response regulator [Aurantiacibacter rhizosphaerae]
MTDKSKTKPHNGKKTKPKKLGRVLLVEDDAILAMTLEDALRAGGAEEVIICHTMKATVEELEKDEKLDALILDVHLADRDDGWALAELVAMLGPKRPWIAFATGSPKAIPPEIAEMGPVFEKPYDPEQLVKVMSDGRKQGLFSRLLG